MTKCVAYSPKLPNPYGYQPSFIVGVIFTAIFGISALVHIFQALTTRNREGRRFHFLWGFVLGATAECAGWAARLLSHDCPYMVLLFKIQLAILILAPSFTMAGIYVIIYVIVPILGHHTLPFPTKWYLIGCIIVDIICLTLQGLGGGLAGAAFSKNADTSMATTIMVVGIIIQLALITVFDGLFTLVMIRGWKTIRKARNLMVLCGVTKLVVTCMVIRGVYRTLELLQGWRGYLITHERFAIGLEGTMMAISVVAFNILNPGKLLAKEPGPHADFGQSADMDEYPHVRYVTDPESRK